MDKPAWIMAGRRLGALGRVSNWLIGDWVREGIARWGEKYAEASKITGFDPHSLRNMAYVASRFDLSLRRDNLTWSHHALIAALERDEQIYWLNRTSELRWSVSDLRTMLRSERREADKAQPAGPISRVRPSPDSSARLPATNNDKDAAARATPVALKCPRCGEDVQLPPELLRESQPI